MANGRKTGGRQKGSLNKATRDIKVLAQDFGPAAIAELARLSGLTAAPGAQTETARIAAMKELLDRGYGRPAQHVTTNAEGSLMMMHLLACQSVGAGLRGEALLTAPPKVETAALPTELPTE